MGRRGWIFGLALVLAGCGTGAPVPSASPPRSSVRPGPVASTTAPALPTTAPSSPTPQPLRASLVGTEWSRLPTTQKVVALTFDAGNNGGAVASILATLRAADRERAINSLPTDR